MPAEAYDCRARRTSWGGRLHMILLSNTRELADVRAKGARARGFNARRFRREIKAGGAKIVQWVCVIREKG